MYKTLGLQIAVDPKCKEKLFGFMARLVNYYRQENEHFQIDENRRRSTYRLPVDVGLPPTQDLSIWLWFKPVNRYVKVRVKDISVGGAQVLLPFRIKKVDEHKAGQCVDILLEFDGETYPLSATVRHTGKFEPSKGQQKFLQKYFDAKHPSIKKKVIKDV